MMMTIMMIMKVKKISSPYIIWQVLNSDSFLIMKIINKTKMIELS